MPNWKEMSKDFFYTTPEQTYDEWRELKSFFAGMVVASVIWAIAFAVRCV